MSKRLSDRLQEISDALGYKAKGVHYQRLRPGYWQRSAGAWSFLAVDEDGVEVFGSENTLAQVVEAFDGGWLVRGGDWHTGRTVYADRPPEKL